MLHRRPARTTATAIAAAAVLLSAACASGPQVTAAPAGAPKSASAPATAPATPTTAAATPLAQQPQQAPPAPIPAHYDGTRNATADIKAALAASAKDHREVLLDFGANWCPDCVALDALFRSPGVMPLVQKNYRVVAIDVGKFDHNLDVASAYVNLNTSGIPALVVLTADGKVRTATNDGAFSNARTMDAAQVSAFLTRWSAGDAQ
ncbi:thioredoxin family protein [Streptacidiphilus rugosus]|uniref:thioredoxin family protein n=1 Tax=Streptacidiphilus rugosus TaxID=405783 RepID=UPI00068C7B04|nr:thioredoxin family protein [Streptacidiphilus rugosus]